MCSETFVSRKNRGRDRVTKLNREERTPSWLEPGWGHDICLPSETFVWKSYSWAPSQATGFLSIRVARAVSWEGPCLRDLELPLLSSQFSHWLGAAASVYSQRYGTRTRRCWKSSRGTGLQQGKRRGQCLESWFVLGALGEGARQLHPCSAMSICTFLFQL